ncbi:coatomer epsilon subunit-domain-containing protein [Boletus edulis]|uniref:Coatomer subunit epsilon n=1 Tax=Boletus edulis BED1 TaxID=1328754 RepID=A0AAD4C4J6_BOLED|nr:coatomer epsilon subunit-domain-containing protein [Boletus edulis]KAF8448971.1 coatomer epsilon subunit-domain-containing protein [Boletus edulis BED1]
MDSSELYHIKQQFALGAYPALIQTVLPDPSSPDYIPTILYKARAYLALGDPASALALIPDDSENVALRAVAALAQGEEGLESLRDLCVETEAEGDEPIREWERDAVAVLAATAFIRAGEVEEAIETLRDSATAGTESSAALIHIYLSLSRPNTARKILSTALQATPDALVLQLSEAVISLATGAQGTSGEPYASAISFYTEQLANPSVSSAALLVGRGVVRILRGEWAAARSDLEEAESILSRAQTVSGVDEVLAGLTIAVGLGAGKRSEAEELWSRLSSQYPSHPMVADISSKADLFDSCAAKFEIPPRAVVAAS